MTASIRSRLLRPVGLLAILGGLLLAALIVLGPMLFAAQAEATSVAERLQLPSAAHPFGTDELGRDVLARVLAAGRLSLLLAFGAAGIAAACGIVLGLVPIVLPSRARRVFTGLIDILMTFPWLLLALFFSVIWGASATGAMLAVAFASVPGYARLAYNLGSSVMGRDYVRAARIVGVGPAGVLLRHVLPNIARPLAVNIASHASTALLSFSALSFLGLGVQAPQYDWGRLLQDGLLRIYVNPMAAIGPGIAVVLSGLIVTLVSIAVGDPGTRRRRGGPASAQAGPRRAAGASPVPAEGEDVLEVRGLRLAFPGADAEPVERVHGVDLRVGPGEVVGIVGESGSGKSITVMAAAGLIEQPALLSAETLRLRGVDMHAPLSRPDADRLGVEVGMVFQDPLTSLNPALTIGRQLTEVGEVHQGRSRAEARERARAALEAVGIDDPERRLRQYPHELSGGMRQRAMIAMGLMGDPQLLIADEPTTALDVTVQRQVIGVLRAAQRRTGTAMIFISHDIALVSGFCDRVVVMKDGLVVETLPADRLLQEARHPYTRALIACVPDMTSDRTRPLPVIGDLEAAAASPATAGSDERKAS